MKPLNFLSFFAGFFVILMLFGMMFSLIDNGDLSAIVSIGLISIVAALILAALTIRIRATDPQNVNKIFRLNLLFWFCYWLAKMVLIRLSAVSELSFLKLLLILGIVVLGAFFSTKMAMMSLSKKTA